jgi:hypothetical protein
MRRRKSAEYISPVLKQFRIDQQLLREQKYELLVTNPHEWVGVHRRVFVFAPTLKECIKMLGVSPSCAAITYLDPVAAAVM